MLQLQRLLKEQEERLRQKELEHEQRLRQFEVEQEAEAERRRRPPSPPPVPLDDTVTDRDLVLVRSADRERLEDLVAAAEDAEMDSDAYNSFLEKLRNNWELNDLRQRARDAKDLDELEARYAQAESALKALLPA